MKRIMALVCGVILLPLMLSACDDNASGASDKNKPPQQQNASNAPATSVDYIAIEPTKVSLTSELPGRVVSYRVAEIRPQVSGIIKSRQFKEGSFVEEGQQLYQIDPARYEADYQMAKARLQDARAQVRNAKLLINRYDELVDVNAVSAQEYDNAKAEFDRAKAAVSLAEAEVETAKINLEYTKVYAPINGYISPSSVTEGALVTASQDMPLATVRQLDPVYVDLSQSVAEMQVLRERLLNDESNEFRVSLIIGPSATRYSENGVLDATDIAVDQNTGSIRLRSVFPNPDNVLLPGMFVRANIEDAGQAKAILVPQNAVHIEPDGSKTVWVIGPENKARKQTVVTGAASDGNWVILSGLEAGDKVITAGVMGLSEGASIKPNQVNIDENSQEENPLVDETPSSDEGPQESTEE